MKIEINYKNVVSDFDTYKHLLNDEQIEYFHEIIESSIEFYSDDDEIKNTIDEFIELVNNLISQSKADSKPTKQQLGNKTFKTYLSENDFAGLFITKLGWNNPEINDSFIVEGYEDRTYNIHPTAQKVNFCLYTCNVASEMLPNLSELRKINIQLQKRKGNYLLIFILDNSTHHCWICPVKSNGKNDIVRIEYKDLSKSDFLYSKLHDLDFKTDGRENEITGTDVENNANKAFSTNSEEVTKKFYDEFNKKHKEFCKFVSGISDTKNVEWYTSVMLNRLMFCYFIQKKGFLDNDIDYLKNKLHIVQEEEGKNKFYGTFYKNFLISLFHDGLNANKRDEAWKQRFGDIPYLNGGMFEVHTLEKNYPDLDIADDAFVKLFDFFDKWKWHLDTRIEADGKSINPDVLGYIFEQYINERATTGAYYTKEDITEYISKNCILPFLFDKLAGTSSKNDLKPDGYVWTTLKNSGLSYIYDAVKKGFSDDWQSQIPENIARGIDTTQPNLLDRRADWNTPTDTKFALPTEIWRETIERLQRCSEIKTKIETGEINHINDFITYNLNIRQFAEDLIQNTNDHNFVRNFYKELQKITILDPTCGSGAFLFAALNILEPLYEICIYRMQEFNKINHNVCKDELREIEAKYKSNTQYYIYKTIILRNLYGVDIMKGATEIAKLRLFLKLVATVEKKSTLAKLRTRPATRH